MTVIRFLLKTTVLFEFCVAHWAYLRILVLEIHELNAAVEAEAHSALGTP